MKERIEGARPMMDLMAKKIFSNVKFQRNFTLDWLYQTFMLIFMWTSF